VAAAAAAEALTQQTRQRHDVQKPSQSLLTTFEADQS
jgi:hypothetical protein